MTKTTAQIIIASVIVLVIINATLIALMWGERKSKGPPERIPIEEINAFIIKEIGFDQKQAEKFIEFSNKHHRIQRENQGQFKKIKDQINQLLLEGDDVKMDSLINELADVSVRRESELYRFFKDVIVICNEEQKRKLQKVFFEATGPPEYARVPFENGPRGPRPPR